MKELTKEWSEFDGNYEKEMQDVKLKNGDIITMCWPNAGFFGMSVEKKVMKNITAINRFPLKKQLM
jgi:hypothetical protein